MWLWSFGFVWKNCSWVRNMKDIATKTLKTSSNFRDSWTFHFYKSKLPCFEVVCLWRPEYRDGSLFLWWIDGHYLRTTASTASLFSNEFFLFKLSLVEVEAHVYILTFLMWLICYLFAFCVFLQDFNHVCS